MSLLERWSPGDQILACVFVVVVAVTLLSTVALVLVARPQIPSGAAALRVAVGLDRRLGDADPRGPMVRHRIFDGFSGLAPVVSNWGSNLRQRRRRAFASCRSWARLLRAGSRGAGCEFSATQNERAARAGHANLPGRRTAANIAGVRGTARCQTVSLASASRNPRLGRLGVGCGNAAAHVARCSGAIGECGASVGTCGRRPTAGCPSCSTKYAGRWASCDGRRSSCRRACSRQSWRGGFGRW